MGRLVRRAGKTPGSIPGTLVHTGLRRTEHVTVHSIRYSADSIDEVSPDLGEQSAKAVDDLPPGDGMIEWINVDGLHDTALVAALGSRFGVHSLALEDVLSTGQRPKVEEYGDHFLLSVKMLRFDEPNEAVIAEQVSLIAGHSFLLSFQEQPGDVLDPVRLRLRQGRGKIRSRGTDYLAYALLDAIVDNYFRILEAIGDRIEGIEDTVLEDSSVETAQRIYRLKREMLVLRRAIWPLREATGLLYRGEVAAVQDETQLFFRDVYDHTIQVIDTVETLREVLSGTLDLYMSGVSNRMNEVMKVLTIIATIFIPLSFFAGLYGMNFQYMPELGIRWAYPALLVAMAVMAGGMLFYFRKRGWL